MSTIKRVKKWRALATEGDDLLWTNGTDQMAQGWIGPEPPTLEEAANAPSLGYFIAQIDPTEWEWLGPDKLQSMAKGEWREEEHPRWDTDTDWAESGPAPGRFRPKRLENRFGDAPTRFDYDSRSRFSEANLRDYGKDPVRFSPDLSDAFADVQADAAVPKTRILPSGPRTLTVEGWEYKKPDQRYTEKVDVLVNPTQADLMRWAGRDVTSVRFLRWGDSLEDGNIVFWNAYEALHEQVSNALEKAGDLTPDQLKAAEVAVLGWGEANKDPDYHSPYFAGEATIYELRQPKGWEFHLPGIRKGEESWLHKLWAMVFGH